MFSLLVRGTLDRPSLVKASESPEKSPAGSKDPPSQGRFRSVGVFAVMFFQIEIGTSYLTGVRGDLAGRAPIYTAEI